MNFKLIACKVLFREVCSIAAKCPNFIDTTFLKQNFHDTPEKLQLQLQNEIDKLDKGDDNYTSKYDFDAILLGYGLCSNAILNLRSKKYTIVVPKAHDCISIFLGSKDKYREYFDSHSGGVYWYNQGWIENTPMPSKERYDNTYNSYLEKYGEDNAEYLMEMEQDWLTKYNICTYIKWNQLENKKYIDYTKNCAKYLGWEFDELVGSPSLLEDFLNGNWSDDKFLVVRPGKTIAPTYDEDILKVE